MVATLDHTPMTFDGLTDGAAFTNSDGLTVSGAAPIVKTSAAIHGARGINWGTGVAGRLMFDYGSDQTSRPIMSSGYFRINAWATTLAMYMGVCQSLVSGGVQQGDWRIDNATKFVTIRNATTAPAGGLGTSNYALLLSTIYRYEWKIIDSTNTQNLKIFVGENVTPVIDLTSTNWTMPNNRVFFVGPTSNAAGFDVDFDTLRFADDFVGPFGTPLPPIEQLKWHRKAPGGWQDLIPHHITS